MGFAVEKVDGPYNPKLAKARADYINIPKIESPEDYDWEDDKPKRIKKVEQTMKSYTEQNPKYVFPVITAEKTATINDSIGNEHQIKINFLYDISGSVAVAAGYGDYVFLAQCIVSDANENLMIMGIFIEKGPVEDLMEATGDIYVFTCEEFVNYCNPSPLNYWFEKNESYQRIVYAYPGIKICQCETDEKCMEVEKAFLKAAESDFWDLMQFFPLKGSEVRPLKEVRVAKKVEVQKRDFSE